MSPLLNKPINGKMGLRGRRNHDMTLNQMECFVEAARCLNFTRAADQLYMSQQTMSRQIKALEKELGFEVFERKNVGVRLTEAGSILYHAWEKLLDEYRGSVDKAKDAYYGGVTQIRVGVSDLGAYIDNVSRALLYFNEEYPELDVSFNVEPFPNMQERIMHNQLDLIITYGAELLRAPELNKIPVSNTRYDVGIIISKKHPLSRKTELGIEDIRDEQIAVLGQELSNDHEERIRKWFTDNHVETAPHMRVYNSFRNLQIALATGKCVAVMFRRVMDGMEDRLKFYPIKDPDYAGADIVVAWKKEKYETKARYIAQLLERQAREL